MADKSKLHRSVPARVHVIGSLEIRDIAESDSASPVAEFSRSVASRVCVGGRLGFRSIIRRKATTRASLHFSGGKAEVRGFIARKCRCAKSDYRRRFSFGFMIAESYEFPESRSNFQVGLASCLLLASSRDSGAACARDRGCGYSVVSDSFQFLCIVSERSHGPANLCDRIASRFGTLANFSR